MEVKIVVSENGKSKTFELKSPDAEKLIGLKIGDTFNGELIGLAGKKLKITGGSDKDGFPMVNYLEGTRRYKMLLSEGPGFKPKRKGERRRKSIRGDTIDEDIAQLNVIVLGEKNKENS